MKNSKEILDTVLKMRDEYYTKKKRRRNLAVRFSALVPVAVVILININSKPHKDIWPYQSSAKGESTWRLSYSSYFI